jgi:hypothetical protein
MGRRTRSLLGPNPVMFNVTCNTHINWFKRENLRERQSGNISNSVLDSILSSLKEISRERDKERQRETKTKTKPTATTQW